MARAYDGTLPSTFTAGGTVLTSLNPNPIIEVRAAWTQEIPPILEVVLRVPWNPQQDLVDLYAPYVRSSDYAVSYYGDANINYTLQLPSKALPSWGTSVEIIAKIPTYQNSSVKYIGYNLEPSVSAPEDLDPVAYTTTVSNALHAAGLKLVFSPSRNIAEANATLLAPLVDVWSQQFQGLCPFNPAAPPGLTGPSAFASRVIANTALIRAAHPGIPVITQLSAIQSDLDNMKECWDLVKNYIDGATIFYGLTQEDLDQTEAFIQYVLQ